VFVPVMVCTVFRQTPQPGPELEQLGFDIQTATPTEPPVLEFENVPTYTPDPKATAPVSSTVTGTLTAITGAALEPEAAATQGAAGTEPAVPTDRPALPETTPTVPVAEPLQGGEWDFEAGFNPWTNPYGDSCAASGLANGWIAFTTRDQFGSSCMNQTTWQDNVYLGENAQEITFAYVGNEAGIYKSAPTSPGHRYNVTAYMRREFSPAKVEVALGIDANGGTNWQAETVEWYAWDEDFDDQWSKTVKTVTALAENMTIFVKGSHPYPEPGGALRIDSITVVDLGPE
jgi:hypothetical protein